jgi:WD40 repeat protein
MKSRLLPLGLCIGLAFTCRLFASGNPELQARSVVETGHIGAVRCLEFDDKRNLLFSGGDDGTVRIWDAATQSIVHTLQVTQLLVQKIAIDPSAPRVAMIVGDGAGTFLLSVWDWERERQVFKVPLKDNPLFLRYSGAGTYLYFGVSSWQSMTILRSADGTPFDFHPEGFGIVGFAEMSRSEKTILTYQLSGRLSYWDVSTGQQTLDLPAAPYLSNIRISPDRRYIAGSTGSDVEVIDTVTGVMSTRIPVSGAVSLGFSPAGDELACLSVYGNAISRWNIGGAAPVAVPAPPKLPVPPVLLTYGSDRIFAAGSDGGLMSVAQNGELSQFGRNVLANLTGFDATRGSAALASQDWVRILDSDILSGAAAPTYIHSRLAPNPFKSPVGLEYLGDSQLLAWRGDALALGLALLPDQGSAFQIVQSGFHSPLSMLVVQNGSAIGIESGGTVRIVDLASGASRFELRIPGIHAAVQASPTEIIAARNSTAASAGSLLRVNTTTGETVTVKDRNIFTWAVALDASAPAGPALYSIGVDASGATNLLRHDGAGFDHESLIDSVPTEDLDANMTFDPHARQLYASMGKDRVIRWDGVKVQPLVLENAVSLQLAAHDGLLFSLNKDSTVTVVDSGTGARLGEIALFADGEWCVLLRDGKYAASTGGDLHVRVFAGGTVVKSTEDFRLRVSIQ